jgi:hypothetical protein
MLRLVINGMLKHIFLFSLFVFAVCSISFCLLQLDEKVHVKQIAQFKENVRTSAKMKNAQESAENLLFSKETLKRMERNYAEYLAFRDILLWVFIISFLVALLSGTLVKFKFPENSDILLGAFTLFTGFLPIYIYSLKVEHTYDAGGFMFLTPYAAMWMFEIIYITKALLYAANKENGKYSVAALVLGSLLLISVLYVLLMASVLGDMDLG